MNQPKDANSQQPLSNTAFAACALLLICAVAVSTAIGCGWSFATEHSVRFTGYSTKSEFTRLPPLPVKPDARRKALVASQALEEEAEYEAGERREAELDDLWVRAGNAEQQRNYTLSARLLREYLQQSAAEYDGGWWDVAPLQLRRNSAVDRLDALMALGQGAKPAALSAYLALRREYDQALLGEIEAPISFNALRQKLDEMKPHPALADNTAYLHAATLHREEKTDEARKAFSELANKYRRSEKREAALLMVGRAEVKRFEQTLKEADNEMDQNRWRARQSARETLQQCLRDYPRGRFSTDARGWLARLSLLEGDHAVALVEYYRLLSEATDPISRESLLASLRLTRHHVTDEEMRQVEATLADEPAAALTYAYHNLYNYAPNAGYYKLDCEGQYFEMDDQKREDFSRRAERDEKARVVAFADKLLRRYPRAAVGGGFALRLAQAQLEMGEYAPASRSASLALLLGVKDRERTEALWVKGSSELHLQNPAAARMTLKQLITEFPESDLAEGAGRMIAMAAEDAGDLDGALEQYIALGYEDDIAYFIDVLMTPEQLAGFIARHAASPRLNELNHALAVRYLRGNRWAEARAALAKVKVTEADSGDGYYDGEKIDDPVEFRSSGRTAKVPSYAPGIAARWLWRDQKTIEDLQRLKTEADQAQDDEAKAEALYQLASYLYQSSSLLFYNPGLWGGSRHYKLEELAFGNSFRAPGEAQLLRQHMQEHEPVAHALEIYLEIARRFPSTRAARDALYTASVCHERLSDYNNYWRNLYGMGMHAGARLVTYKDVRREYPGYQLPRGTIGWEPRTRTVNGGAGWTAPPKPAPRLTRRARLKQQFADSYVGLRRKQEGAVAWLSELWNGLVAGLIYSVLAVILLAACYFTTMGPYLKNQQPSHTALFEKERIDAMPPDHLAGSPVEKLISESDPPDDDAESRL